MKDLVKKINEGKDCRLFSEVQNEIDNKKGEYHSYDFSGGQKKYKKGFVVLNQDNEFVAITAFNTAKDFADMIGTDEKYYK